MFKGGKYISGIQITVVTLNYNITYITMADVEVQLFPNISISYHKKLMLKGR